MEMQSPSGILMLVLILTATFSNSNLSTSLTNLQLWHRIFNETTTLDLDLEALLVQFSLICPLHRSCDIISNTTRSRWTYEHFPNCPMCDCDPDCAWRRKCCPGTPYGYFNVDCINVAQLPHNRTVSYPMVAVCPGSFAGPSHVRQRCENDGTETNVAPVTSYDTLITYKNKYCAMCNNDWGTMTKTWTLHVTCPEAEHVNAYQSFSQLKRKLIENGCLVVYEPPQNYRTSQCKAVARQRVNQVEISQCNVTGLWQQYDSGIEWACSRLESPYGVFKNVFCYICNPSVISSKSRDLIESCNITGRWLQYDRETEYACLSESESQRLHPFKNRYCALCNGLLQYYEFEHIKERGAYIDIRQTFSRGLRTTVEMDIKFWHSGQHIMRQVKSFSGRFYKNETYKLFSNKALSKSIQSNLRNVQSSLEAYFDVCGRHGCLKNNSFAYGDTLGIQTAPNHVCGECSCNSMCAESNTCCMDTLLAVAPYSCMASDELSSFGNQYIDIVNETYHNGLYVIDKCLNQSYNNTDIIDKCERWMELTSGDALLGIPVETKQIPYRNIYCLECNNDNPSTLKLSVIIKCDRYIEFQLIVTLDDISDIAREYCRITFHVSDAKPCNMNYLDVRIMHFREILPTSDALPASLQMMIQRYTTIQSQYSYIAKCNVTGAWIIADNDIREVCENGEDIMLPLQPYSINNVTYANFACFLCNPDSSMTTIANESVISTCNMTGMWTETDEWTRNKIERMCNTTGFQSRWLPFSNVYCSICNLAPTQRVFVEVRNYDYEKSYPSHRLLFSLNPDEWASIQQAPEDEHIQPECASGMTDALDKTCPDVCSTNRHLINGSCVPLISSISDAIYDMTLHLHSNNNTPRTGSYEDIDVTPWYDANCTNISCVKIDLQGVCTRIAYVVTRKFTNDTRYHVENCKLQANTPCVDDTVIQMSEASHIDITFSIFVIFTNDILNIEDTLVNAQSALYTFRVNKTLTYSYQGLSAPHKAKTESPCSIQGIMVFRYFESSREKPTNRFTVNKFLSCAHVQFSDKYFTYNNETDSVVITKTRKVTLSTGTFKIVNSTLHACREDVIISNTNISKRSPISAVNYTALAFGIFSTTCKIVSIVCLLVTLVTYCLFKSLRTVPGRNNMTLVIFLIAAQLCLQFGVPLPNTYSVLCPLVGALTHFVWLATFFSMNICCFHMFRVFHWQALVSHNTSASDKQCLIYVLYVIVSSALVVVCTVGGHLVASEGEFTGYGKYVCFISERLTLILAFIVPSCLIFASNVLFFSLAFHKIRTSPHMGAASSSNDRHDLVVYIKLCTLVGLAWPLQLVASNVPLSAFTFVVEGINALQGMFIFFAYVCQARIMAMYRSKFSRCSQRNKPERLPRNEGISNQISLKNTTCTSSTGV